LALLPDALRRRLLVNLQCREEDVTNARDILAHSGIAGEVAAFFNDMPTRLGAAHLVIARAGASTVAELAVAGRPALLVPYPHATDDHQSENARQISAAGGAEVIAETAVAPETLATTLSELLRDDTRLIALADGARRFSRPDAAEALANLAEAVISDSLNASVTPARAA
jgi:UDP-N-acetylglucosamine--N-acetylmuramyl-(pentapeptide) pyrophosphoryl-undecaprenol N-acetylglucosamine transferase